MKADLIRCPQCGATLKVGDAERVTCEYCCTEAHVQHRSRVLQRALPPRTAMPRVPVAVVRIRWGVIAAIFAVTFLVIGGFVIGIVGAVRSSTTARRPAARVTTTTESPPPPPARHLLWLGDYEARLITADADGDGDLDLIGRIREVANEDAVMIVALAGATGATIWETPRLGSYSESYEGPLSVLGDTVLFGSKRGVVTAFALRSGAQRWTVTMPERPVKFCARGRLVGVFGADQMIRDLQLADGEPMGVSSERESGRYCLSPPHDRDLHGLPERIPADRVIAQAVGLDDAEQLVAPGGAVVLSGARAGNHAQLVALDGARAMRWKVDVAPDPLAAAGTAPDIAAMDDDLVCATYELIGSNTPHLACFAVADGARRVDVPTLDDGAFDTLDLTAIGIVMTSSTHVEVRDPATGALRWTYGKP